MNTTRLLSRTADASALLTRFASALSRKRKGVLIFVFGPGAFALDHLLRRKFAPPTSVPASHPQSA